MLSNSDFTFTLSVSEKNYPCKPNGTEMRKCAFIPLQLTAESALQCALQGRAFCYIFKTDNNTGYLPIKEKTNKNFISTSTIIYDFDRMDVDMCDFIQQITYKPSFAYPTYSNGINGESRFRLAYIFDSEIHGENNFEEIYFAIANANQFVRETKEHGGLDVRTVSQMYFGTTSTAETYTSHYIYNLSDFKDFIIPIIKKEQMVNKQSKKVNTDKYDIINKDFLEDFNNLSFDDFFAKYFIAYNHNYKTSLESPLTLSTNEMWYEYPNDYFAVVRKRNGRLILKWDIGEDRKKKLYITAQLMLHNAPNLSLENLIYNLSIERRYYYNNSDNKIDNIVLLQTAINAFNQRITLDPSKHGSFRVNKNFWEEQGISIRRAVGYIRRERKAQEILPYIDFTKSIPENYKMLTENGINISLRTLQRMVARGDISIVMDGGEVSLISKCHNATNLKNEIIEIINNDNTITVAEIAKQLGIDKSTAQRNINKMRGIDIEREGNNRTGYWRIINKSS